jgi:hypothetical protein
MVLMLLLVTLEQAAWGASDIYYPSDDQEDSQGQETVYGDEQFSMEELQDLLAPIALYPDPLIAQILPATTFIDQINTAARRVRMMGKDALIDQQEWDVSVKAIAHYPELLYMMDQDHGWAVALGQAFINQREEVLQAIQLLRQQARATGNLVSTPQQQVIVENGYIRIIPAQPDLIYLPQYDPQMVYVEPPPPEFGLVSFGIGFTIGAWLNRDCDWHGRRIYYHGWQGRGWIGRARPHVHARSSVYVNTRYTIITTNSRVLRYNSGKYRTGKRRDTPHRAERQAGAMPGQRPVTREQRPVITTTTPHPRTEIPRPQHHSQRPLQAGTPQPQPAQPRTAVPRGYRRSPDRIQSPAVKTVPLAGEQSPNRQPGSRHDGRRTAAGTPRSVTQPDNRSSDRAVGQSRVNHKRERYGREAVHQNGQPAPARHQQAAPPRQAMPRRQPSAVQPQPAPQFAPVQQQRTKQQPVGGNTGTAAPRSAGQTTLPANVQPKPSPAVQQPRIEHSAPHQRPQTEQRPTATGGESPSRQSVQTPSRLAPESTRAR